jgi:hypothetical protein
MPLLLADNEPMDRKLETQKTQQNKQHGSRIKTTQLIKKHMRSTWVPRVFTAIRK